MSNHGVFNSLYLISNKVKDDTSDALQTVLNHQSQLLKELLHGSLCPILLNMAGPKKLVLTNLEGFTLLLGLLINHFQPVFPEGHCRVHCSVRDRSVQCIPNHLYPAFGSFHSQIPKSESVEYFFSMMRSEHHTGMHSFHNILISKSALVFLEQLQGKTSFLISHCIHDADSSIYLC